MAKQPSKRQHAAQKASARAEVNSVPKPFEAAPEKLDAFLQVLDPELMYIVHVDRQSIDFKKQIFTVPILLNVAIVVGLAARLYFVLPYYLDLLFIALGVPTSAAVDPASHTDSELRAITLRRTATLVLDFALFRYIGAWAWLFFVGDGLADPPVSPARWRYLLGYRPAEVVVRASRRWGAADFWRDGGPGGATARARLLPSLDREWMRERTGYMMMGRDFELDFGAMLHAHDLVDKDRVNSERDFELCVLVRTTDEVPSWCVWRLNEAEGGAADANPLVVGGMSQAQAREKIEAFRERLVQVGKESLFYRFIEIVQYESNQQGGLTPERRARALSKVRDIFERASVDFDKFIEDLGGEDQLPGFERPEQTQ